MIYLDNDYGDIIKVNGKCYRLIGQFSNQPDFAGPPDESGYADCDECALSTVQSSSSSSSLSSSSSSSSTINQSTSSSSSTLNQSTSSQSSGGDDLLFADGTPFTFLDGEPFEVI